MQVTCIDQHFNSAKSVFSAANGVLLATFGDPIIQEGHFGG